ncbi:MAG: hypothetical protein R3C53_14915 [Pirellulaceae bacterium]
MNPDIPAPDGAADEVGVMVGDAEIVDGGNCFGRADRSQFGQRLSLRPRDLAT